MNHLIINPSDIYYLTGIRSHDPGEILIISLVQSSKFIELRSLPLDMPLGISPVQNEGIGSVIPESGNASEAAGEISGIQVNELSAMTEANKESDNNLDSTSRPPTSDLAGMTRKGIIFCDPRTTALFDGSKYEIIDDRKKWGEGFKNYPELTTDPDFLTQTLREKIEGYGVKLSMQPSPIVKARLLKKTEEIELIMESQRLNKKVYEMIVPFLVPGVTESSIARKIQILQLELGADGQSFPPIVAFAEHTAIPHHSPTEKVLQVGDSVLLDTGLIYQGYCSDMTRCLTIGDGAHGFDEIYSLLQIITQEIIAWAKPGMRVAELDKKAREMMGEYEPYFTHSLGHGVGIDIHEAPHISTRSEEILEPGMIITIEPGIYLAGKYGARYEEMVVVDKEKLSLI